MDSTDGVEKMRQPEKHNGNIDEARSEWLKVHERAEELANKLYREYNDIERRRIEFKMLDLQRSQRLASWASFVVAAAVGLATIDNIVVALLK